MLLDMSSAPEAYVIHGIGSEKSVKHDLVEGATQDCTYLILEEDILSWNEYTNEL